MRHCEGWNRRGDEPLLFERAQGYQGYSWALPVERKLSSDNRGQAMMTKEELAFEQEKMRERWKSRPAKGRAAQSRRVLVATVLVEPMRKLVPAKAIPRPAKPSAGLDQHQERFALGFSLGVPPVRTGYSTAEIEYACACGVFSNNPSKCPKCGRQRLRRTNRNQRKADIY